MKYTHPDLAANMWTNPKESENGNDDDGNGYVDDIHGYNFVENGPITWDKAVIGIDGSNNGDSGHGTHVAGTIAAVNNNGIGVAGVAGGSGKNDGVRLMSCQIFSGGKSAADAATARAVKYAADNGACIIQCSYGYSNASGGSNMTTDKRFKEFSPLLVEHWSTSTNPRTAKLLTAVSQFMQQVMTANLFLHILAHTARISQLPLSVLTVFLQHTPTMVLDATSPLLVER